MKHELRNGFFVETSIAPRNRVVIAQSALLVEARLELGNACCARSSSAMLATAVSLMGLVVRLRGHLRKVLGLLVQVMLVTTAGVPKKDLPKLLTTIRLPLAAGLVSPRVGFSQQYSYHDRVFNE